MRVSLSVVGTIAWGRLMAACVLRKGHLLAKVGPTGPAIAAICAKTARLILSTQVSCHAL